MAGQLGIKTNLSIDATKLNEQIKTIKTRLAEDNAFKINISKESLTQLKELQALVKDITTMAGKGITVKVNYKETGRNTDTSKVNTSNTTDKATDNGLSALEQHAKAQERIEQNLAEKRVELQRTVTTKVNGILKEHLLTFQDIEKQKHTFRVSYSEDGVNLVEKTEKKSNALRMRELREYLEKTKKGYESVSKVAGFKNMPDFAPLFKQVKKLESEFSKNGEIGEDSFQKVNSSVVELDKNLSKMADSSGKKLNNIKVTGSIQDSEIAVKKLRASFNELEAAYPEFDKDGTARKALEDTERKLSLVKKSSLGTGTIAFKDMSNGIKNAKFEIDNFKKSVDLATGTDREVDKLTNKLATLWSHVKNGHISADIMEDFKNQIMGLRETEGGLESVKKRSSEIAKEIDNTKISAKQATEALKGMGNQSHGLKRVSDALAEMGIYFSAWRLTSEIFQEFKRGISIVSELDNQIVQVGIDMNVTAEESKKLLQESQRIAVETGIGIEEIIRVAGVYSNQTETMASVLAKVKPSAILAGVADASATEITDMFQGVVNQYKLATDDIEALSYEISDSIIGVSKNLAQNFDTSVKEISDVMLDAGAVMSELGYTYQETMAMAGSIMEVTRQSGSELGGALRMIGARIGGAKNTGEDVDVEEISNAAKAYKEIGIEIINSDGSFKAMKDTLNELSLVWDDLTDVERSYIAEMSAGNRRRNTFMVLMDTMGKQTELTNIAMNSQGDTLAANEKYLESTAAKMQNFTNAMDTLWQNTISSDAIKKILEIGTGFVKIADSIGVVNIALGSFVSYLVLTGRMNTFFETTLSNVVTEFYALASSSALAKTGVAKYGLAMVGATAKVIGFKVAVVAAKVALSFALSFAITGIISLLSKFASEFESSAEKIEKFKNNVGELSDELKRAKDLQNSIEENEIALSIAGDDDEKSAEIKEEILSLQKQLAEVLPETASKFTGEGEAIAENTEKVKGAIEAKEDLIATEARLYLAEKGFDNAYKVKNMREEGRVIDENIKKTQKYLEAGEETIKIQKQVVGNYGFHMQEEEVNNVEELNRLLKEREEYNENAMEWNRMIDATGDTSLQYLKMELIEYDQIEDSVKKIVEESEKLDPIMSTTVRTVEELDEAISKSASNMGALQDIIDEIDDKEFDGISEGSVQTIIEKYPELIQYMNDEKVLREKLAEMYDMEKQLSNNALAVKLANLGAEGKAHFNTMNQKVANDKEWYRVNVLNNAELIKTFKDMYGIDLRNWNTLLEAKNASDRRYIATTTSNFSSMFGSIAAGYNQIIDAAYKTQDEANKTFGRYGKNMLIESDYNGGAPRGKVIYRGIGVTTSAFNGVSWSGVNPSTGTGSGSGSGSSGSDKDKKTVYESDEAYFNKHTALIEEYQRRLEALERKISATTERIAYYKEIGSDSALENALILQNRLYAEQTEKVNLLNRAQAEMQRNQNQIASQMRGYGIDMSTQTAEDLNYWLDKLFPKIKSTNQAAVDAQNDKREAFTISWENYMDYADELITTEEQILAMQNELLSILKEKYEIEFDLIERRLENIRKLTDDVNDQLALLNDSSSYNERESLMSQSLSTLMVYRDELETTLNTLMRQRDALVVGSAEWTIINEEVEEYQDKLQDTNEEILQTQQNLKALRDEELNNSLSLLDKIAASVRKQYEEAKKAELDALKAALDAEVGVKRKELEILQARLDALNDTTRDKEDELKALRDEAKMWEGDNSVYAKSRLAELEKLIKEKERELEKDRIQNEMDNLEEEIEAIEEANQEKVEEVEKTYDELLADQNVYQQASLILMNASQEDILNLLLSYDERYKGMGSVLGAAFATGLMEEIAKGLDSFDSMSDGLLGSGKIPWITSLPKGYTYDASGGIVANGLGAYSTGGGLTNDVMIGEDGNPVDISTLRALYDYKQAQMAIENANVTMNVNFYTNGQLDVERSIHSLGDMLTGSLAGSGSMLKINK